MQTCVERIIRTDDQAFETIKMQVYFDTNYPVQLDFLRAEKQSRVQESHKLVSEIHETKAKSVSVIEGIRGEGRVL